MDDAEDILEQIAVIPIDEILDEIAHADDKPIVAIGMAQVRAADAAPRLLAVLADAANGDELDDPDKNLLFYGLHILGAARNPAAFPPLMRLLRLPAETVDDLLGHAITESLAKIVAGAFDGDAETLFALLGDATIDSAIRAAPMGALAFLTWEGRIDPGETRRFLERFDDERLADDDFAEMLWDAWRMAIALLGWRDLTPRVGAAIEDGRIPPEFGDLDDHLLDLARAEAEPGSHERFAEANLGYIDDILVALDWAPDSWADTEAGDAYDAEDGLDDDPDDPDDEPGEPSPDYRPSIPITNPYRHVGRNDPCPCGSGRKAKKCCLATA